MGVTDNNITGCSAEETATTGSNNSEDASSQSSQSAGVETADSGGAVTCIDTGGPRVPGRVSLPAVGAPEPSSVEAVAVTALSAGCGDEPPELGPPAAPKSSGESYLLAMFQQMDMHMHVVRSAQQSIITAMENEFRSALGPSFGRLVLVGSGALAAETPGSDMDVVCFTSGSDKPFALEILRKVYLAFANLASTFPKETAELSAELIDARVPILRVVLGSVAVDVSINQERPVAHVKWLQGVGAAFPGTAAPSSPPLITVLMRTVKSWLQQRQIPKAKEGGWPTLAWLFMVVHTCSSKDLMHLVSLSQIRPMAAIIAALGAFFRQFGAIGGLVGTLRFVQDGTSSEFIPHSDEKASYWGNFSLQDPTADGTEILTTTLPPATQLLLVYELRRAAALLAEVQLHTSIEEVEQEAQRGDHGRLLAKVFESPSSPSSMNLLPVFVNRGVGVILFCEDGTLQVALLDAVDPKRGWRANFLHRADNRSELHVRLLEVNEKTGYCNLRKKNPITIFCPCHCVCCIGLHLVWAHKKQVDKQFQMDEEGLDRLHGMRQYLAEVKKHRGRPPPPQQQQHGSGGG